MELHKNYEYLQAIISVGYKNTQMIVTAYEKIITNMFQTIKVFIFGKFSD